MRCVSLLCVLTSLVSQQEWLAKIEIRLLMGLHSHPDLNEVKYHSNYILTGCRKISGSAYFFAHSVVQAEGAVTCGIRRR